jgi:hypothetical protein
MIAVLPRSEDLETVLTGMDGILTSLDRDVPEARGPFPTEADLPAPRWLPEGEIRVAEYPHRNPDQPSPLLFAWRPERTLSPEDEVLLRLFLANFAGDPTTNLYRVFVDTEGREVDLGPQSVSGWASRDQGHPVYIQLSDVAPSQATPERLVEARERILEELRTIADWPDRAPEVLAFNSAVRDRVVSWRTRPSRWTSRWTIACSPSTAASPSSGRGSRDCRG